MKIGKIILWGFVGLFGITLCGALAAPEIVALINIYEGCDVKSKGGVPGFSSSYDIKC